MHHSFYAKHHNHYLLNHPTTLESPACCEPLFEMLSVVVDLMARTLDRIW